MKYVISSLLAALLLSCSAGAFAQQAGAKPEQLIKWRQSVYQVLGWNSSRIKANVDGQFNKEEVVRSANTIAALANSGIGALFAPGTETGKGWKETATKPEFFKNQQKVGELAGNFNREANELAKVAASGDSAAIKAQFGKLSQTCKACHDDFKVKD
ncbi:c-type cytochrome [Dechloromonas denitrificans]|uniref:c-type cytochrome n=1 Tax=Azonexaceae TaxID=2008795 RepID=UPI001CFBEDFE|nr:cytochrome c [Dechloromonas denitrificans]UCV06019.1 cytochrome c [Dechloromonas denitrificans]